MATVTIPPADKPKTDPLPKHRDLYYGGTWHAPMGGYEPTWNPATGESLGNAPNANAADVDAAVKAAHAGFLEWRRIKPLERAKLMRKLSSTIRANAEELALVDSLNGGNPISAARGDVLGACERIDYMAGLVLELQGHTIPLGEGILDFTVREPMGVIGTLVAYNHPISFAATKFGPVLGAGCSILIKAATQAPLSVLRMMEILDGIVPPGVINVVAGGVECGQAIVAHPQVPRITLIGSVATGRAIASAAGARLKTTEMELGGKNAMIVYPDADIKKAVTGAIAGMNYTWCGQSCMSMSRLFLHESIYDEVLAGVVEGVSKIKPGIPQDPNTKMGAVVSKAQLDKIMSYIELGQKEGGKVILGGKRPSDPALAKGNFVEPTIITGITQDMRIANEEIFGPVQSVIKWSDEEEMIEQVNRPEYGLTASIYTNNLSAAHRTASRIDVGYIWINAFTGPALGTPYGGIKQSGYGRNKVIEEMFANMNMKNINITL
ncbi:MAG: aldehyde dehydrogenase family protein [Gemmatimonas sp.]